MAPRRATSQLVVIRDMITSRSLTTSQMAEAAGCSKRSIITISPNLRMFGDVRAPLIPGGRPRVITPVMLEALCDHLLEKPDLYLDEMAEFLYDEFDVLMSHVYYQSGPSIAWLDRESGSTDSTRKKCGSERLLSVSAVRFPLVSPSLHR